jgi:hypothetical protein
MSKIECDNDDEVNVCVNEKRKRANRHSFTRSTKRCEESDSKKCQAINNEGVDTKSRK